MGGNSNLNSNMKVESRKILDMVLNSIEFKLNDLNFSND
jgi:hypothetical protein